VFLFFGGKRGIRFKKNCQMEWEVREMKVVEREGTSEWGG